MRFIGLDIGRAFAHVALIEGDGPARRLPRVAMGEAFRSFAAMLRREDAVALEASTNTRALADLLGRHAGRVVVSARSSNAWSETPPSSGHRDISRPAR